MQTIFPKMRKPICRRVMLSRDGEEDTMPLSLTRGLEILSLLNKRESASVADVCLALTVPRASAYRLLDALVAEGYLYQHRSDHRYRLTLHVLTLSEGFSDGQHLASVARPFLALVTQRLRWPVSFGVLSGLDLVIRENTDEESPLATDRFKIGYRMPLLTTATGLCIVAHMAVPSRSAVLAALAERDPQSAPGGARARCPRTPTGRRSTSWFCYLRSPATTYRRDVDGGAGDRCRGQRARCHNLAVRESRGQTLGGRRHVPAGADRSGGAHRGPGTPHGFLRQPAARPFQGAGAGCSFLRRTPDPPCRAF